LNGRDEHYTLNYNNNRLEILRKTVLVICILADLTVVAGIIACISAHKFLDILWYLSIEVVALIVRLACSFLCYELILEYYMGRFTVEKRYPLIKRKLIDVDINMLEIAPYVDTETDKVVILCPKSCVNDIYMIKLFNKNYVLRLDDYMYSLLGANK